MNTSHSSRSPLGFTIREMVLALVIMLSIASLVVPLLMGNNAFEVAESRRHARMLSSICLQARKDGVDFVKPGELGVTLQNLLVGGSAANGRRYQAIGMTNRDVEAAARHLRLQEGELLYKPGKL
jgi:type II secretory pathway pseudopilin PulG